MGREGKAKPSKKTLAHMDVLSFLLAVSPLLRRELSKYSVTAPQHPTAAFLVHYTL